MSSEFNFPAASDPCETKCSSTTTSCSNVNMNVYNKSGWWTMVLTVDFVIIKQWRFGIFIDPYDIRLVLTLICDNDINPHGQLLPSRCSYGLHPVWSERTAVQTCPAANSTKTATEPQQRGNDIADTSIREKSRHVVIVWKRKRSSSRHLCHSVLC